MMYPLDPAGTSLLNVFEKIPPPVYPFNNSPLARLIPVSFYQSSLTVAVPITFALLYYTIAHWANSFQRGHDYSKGDSRSAQLLRAFVVLHNAALCLYSLFTFAMTAPVVFDFFLQGWRAAGHEGLKLALCAMPADNSLLGRWTYIFYLSKYYEVMDSVILYLKGKKIGNLQSYHHAGALFSMWIAFRFHSQPAWVFLMFNSGVHTLMYAYYFCAALKLPFPRALKRNLTTLQILQIFFGTLLADAYYIQRVDPVTVYAQLVEKGITSSLPASIFASNGHDAPRLGALQSVFSRSWFGSGLADKASTHGGQALMQLSTYAQARTLYPLEQQSSCLNTTGAAVAVAGNTMYMAPLLVLFANFYITSYLKQQQQQKPMGGTRQNGK